MAHQETSFTNVGDSWMPALASTMLDLVSPMKSEDTTSSWLTLHSSWLLYPSQHFIGFDAKLAGAAILEWTAELAGEKQTVLLEKLQVM